MRPRRRLAMFRSLPAIMNEEKEHIKPKPKGSDAIYALVKGAVSAIPLAGGAVSELFGLYVASPLQKRQEKWLESLLEKIKELEKKSARFSIENLQKNEVFISSLLQATQIAIRNHQEEKLKA